MRNRSAALRSVLVMSFTKYVLSLLNLIDCMEITLFVMQYLNSPFIIRLMMTVLSRSSVKM